MFFHMKQWGEWGPAGYADPEAPPDTPRFIMQGQVMLRLGKKKTGRLLHGQEWSDMPPLGALNG